MPREFPHGEFENEIINESDQAQSFDRRDEFAAGDDTSSQIAHAPQALEIIRLSRDRANHRLEREQQPVLAQRRLHCRPYRCAAAFAFAADLVVAGAHPSVAPGSLGSLSDAGCRPRRELDHRRGAASRPPPGFNAN